VSSIRGRDARTTYGSDLVGYTAELQQILTLKDHTVVFGGRFQTGDIDTRDRIAYTGVFPPAAVYPPAAHVSDTELQRESIYAYDMWQVFQPLQLTAGISYDWLEYPENAGRAAGR
jgi:outer membrane receptor protein involved in Fe transport